MDLDDDGLDDEGGARTEEAAILGEPGLPIQPSAEEANIGDDTAQSDDVFQQYHNFSSKTRKCYSSAGANDITPKTADTILKQTRIGR